ncbi:MAG: hypothetical protein EXS01_00660 [Phycisphaerales bacterium]|nr:hypothetical protein [Phycisphaerales bacterium]
MDPLATLPNPRAALRMIDAQSQRPPSSGGCFHWIAGNPRHESWQADSSRVAAESSDNDIILCWSGTFGAQLFGGDIRNWTKAGAVALTEWLDESLPRLAAPATKRLLGIIPNHTHLLSDVAGQMRLWQDRSSQGLATVLYPSGLIAPSMLKDIDDHLIRSISHLAPRCALCILEDIAPCSEGSARADFHRVAWGRGILPHARIESLLRQHLPVTTPIIVMTKPPFFA